MPTAKPIRPSTRRARRAVLALAIAVAFGTVIGWWHGAWATPPAPGAAVAAQPAAPAPAAAVAPAAPVDPTKVTITFSTVPPAHATVTWGRTRLGRTPLVVVRPRDSGPLDVVVRAAGFLPVQTRAQTFADCRVQVKLTHVDQKATLLGYREPIDAGPSLMGDAGVGVTESFSGTVPAGAPPVAAPVGVAPVTPAPVPAPQAQPKPAPAPVAH